MYIHAMDAYERYGLLYKAVQSSTSLLQAVQLYLRQYNCTLGSTVCTKGSTIAHQAVQLYLRQYMLYNEH